jgi:hypothetical protein
MSRPSRRGTFVLDRTNSQPNPKASGSGTKADPTSLRPASSPLQTRRAKSAQNEPRSPPLGDPSLPYITPESDFIRLPSSRASSSKCVVVLDRTGRGKDKDRKGKGKAGLVLEVNKENIPFYRDLVRGREEEGDGEELGHGGVITEGCLLTDGLLPLMLQTDRLALESIGMSAVAASMAELTNNPDLHQVKVDQSVRLSMPVLSRELTCSGGATSASGYTLQLTNPLNSTGKLQWSGKVNQYS